MITIKSEREIELMRKAGRLTAEAMDVGAAEIRPGVTTKHINDVMEKFIRSKGGKPNFKGYGGFPAAACISVNNRVIHGIPSSEEVLADGDIVSIDFGVLLNGYNGDMARTFGVGNISKEAQRLIDVTKQSFFEGILYAQEGYRLGDVGNAIESYVKKYGFSVVYEYVGHGIGTQLHEDPSVPNYGVKGKGRRLQAGMTLAIEPMVNAGVPDVKRLKDGWTVETADGKLSAHYENTVCIGKGEPLILTSL